MIDWIRSVAYRIRRFFHRPKPRIVTEQMIREHIAEHQRLFAEMSSDDPSEHAREHLRALP